MIIDRDHGVVRSTLVYYGPGLSGKTTNFRYIYSTLDPSSRSEFTNLATDTDRAMLFDFTVPGVEIAALKLRLQLRAVPGHVFYEHPYTKILWGADAVVGVWDSQVERDEANVESLERLERTLVERDYNLSDFPMVHQYNKRDLPSAMDMALMERQLNPRGLVSIPAVATEGTGVVETLNAIIPLIVERLRTQVQ